MQPLKGDPNANQPPKQGDTKPTRKKTTLGSISFSKNKTPSRPDSPPPSNANANSQQKTTELGTSSLAKPAEEAQPQRPATPTSPPTSPSVIRKFAETLGLSKPDKTAKVAEETGVKEKKDIRQFHSAPQNVGTSRNANAPVSKSKENKATTECFEFVKKQLVIKDPVVVFRNIEDFRTEHANDLNYTNGLKSLDFVEERLLQDKASFLKMTKDLIKTEIGSTSFSNRFSLFRTASLAGKAVGMYAEKFQKDLLDNIMLNDKVILKLNQLAIAYGADPDKQTNPQIRETMGAQLVEPLMNSFVANLNSFDEGMKEIISVIAESLQKPNENAQPLASSNENAQHLAFSGLCLMAFFPHLVNKYIMNQEKKSDLNAMAQKCLSKITGPEFFDTGPKYNSDGLTLNSDKITYRQLLAPLFENQRQNANQNTNSNANQNVDPNANQ